MYYYTYHHSNLAMWSQTSTCCLHADGISIGKQILLFLQSESNSQKSGSNIFLDSSLHAQWAEVLPRALNCFFLPSL